MEDVTVVYERFDSVGPDWSFLGVYDGHGGRDIVDFLDDYLEENVARELKLVDDDASVLQRIERAFLITDIQSRQANILTSGATVVVCLIERTPSHTTLYAANCGDARAVLSRNGVARRLTHDHKADDPEEIARIETAGGFIIRNRVLGILAVSRSLGDHALKEYVIGQPFLFDIVLEDTDKFVILACDGVWDVMTDQNAVDIIKKFSDPHDKKDSEKKASLAARCLVD
eukprot:CAMPEP_0113322784 /NCGR_PEP_ID=MMETSP0010_2-20120614/15837_1 /TAXON_ID=216773 ORGANISM="Corethron hystrix, Strain 308" /NCGR_SAMPLE_ID=MMETSP0010_2 /ASSEMBLY_ACC=CAM_ASM_000155 /LENGTH=228 /DNA_ID=CAMNT_0000181401 /DNA_START=331 /DNA_END=1014 /DNA_ORIENTATION=- /assembly_acc=CAM_ASM_000155